MHKTRAVIPPTTPELLCQGIARILESCALPPPFRAGTVPRVVAYAPKLDDKTELKLPTIAYRVVHTLPYPQRRRELLTHQDRLTGTSAVDVYQHDFLNIIQFDCFAGTQEEAGALMWWFIDQMYTYRSSIADMGAQHLRFDECRPEFLTTMAAEKYPARAVRYSVGTSRLYYVPRTILTRVTTRFGQPNSILFSDESVIKGSDTLAKPYVAQIISVTSGDESVMYTPYYDPELGKFVWADELPQPATGAAYRVAYLYYGETSTVSVEAIPDE